MALNEKGIVYRACRKIRKYIGENILKGRFPSAYAHYYYWKSLRKELDWNNPKDINEKLFWLARFWQDPRIVTCADKLAVRDYIKGLGLEYLLTKVYAVYNSVDEIDFSKLPKQYVLKTNHLGGGTHMVIHREGAPLDEDKARKLIEDGLKETIGAETAEYQYLYIPHKAYTEELIPDDKMEIQFFCFNGEPRHILLRNDLGDAQGGFAISYDMNWNRVKDRIVEDMNIDMPRPKQLDELIEVARKLAAPFPQVRVDMYFTKERIYFGELTFSTSGNILWNYPVETRLRWGQELILPNKLKTKWCKVYESQLKKR